MSDDERNTADATPYISRVDEGKPISLAVIDAVGSVSGRPPLDDSTDGESVADPLDMLYEVVDPDALDALCSAGADDTRAATTVTFQYCGYDVTVESTGRIIVAGD